eukprot:jgi/Botrbrau1/16595/Bobra.0068s0025.1
MSRNLDNVGTRGGRVQSRNQGSSSARGGLGRGAGAPGRGAPVKSSSYGRGIEGNGSSSVVPDRPHPGFPQQPHLHASQSGYNSPIQGPPSATGSGRGFPHVGHSNAVPGAPHSGLATPNNIVFGNMHSGDAASPNVQESQVLPPESQRDVATNGSPIMFGTIDVNEVVQDTNPPLGSPLVQGRIGKLHRPVGNVQGNVGQGLPGQYTNGPVGPFQAPPPQAAVGHGPNMQGAGPHLGPGALHGPMPLAMGNPGMQGAPQHSPGQQPRHGYGPSNLGYPAQPAYGSQMGQPPPHFYPGPPYSGYMGGPHHQFAPPMNLAPAPMGTQPSAAPEARRSKALKIVDPSTGGEIQLPEGARRERQGPSAPKPYGPPKALEPPNLGPSMVQIPSSMALPSGQHFQQQPSPQQIVRGSLVPNLPPVPPRGMGVALRPPPPLSGPATNFGSMNEPTASANLSADSGKRKMQSGHPPSGAPPSDYILKGAQNHIPPNMDQGHPQPGQPPRGFRVPPQSAPHQTNTGRSDPLQRGPPGLKAIVNGRQGPLGRSNQQNVRPGQETGPTLPVQSTWAARGAPRGPPPGLTEPPGTSKADTGRRLSDDTKKSVEHHNKRDQDARKKASDPDLPRKSDGSAADPRKAQDAGVLKDAKGLEKSNPGLVAQHDAPGTGVLPGPKNGPSNKAGDGKAPGFSDGAGTVKVPTEEHPDGVPDSKEVPVHEVDGRVEQQVVEADTKKTREDGMVKLEPVEGDRKGNAEKEAAARSKAEAEGTSQHTAEEKEKKQRSERQLEEDNLKREEAAEQRRKEEAADLQRKEKEERDIKRKAQEEIESQRKAEEEAEAKKLVAEAEAKRKAEEAEAQKKAEEEAEAQKKRDDAAAAKKAQEEAEAKRKGEEEAEAKRKAEEEAEAKRKAVEEAEVQRKAAEEAEKKLEADRQAEEQQKVEEQKILAAAEKAKDEQREGKEPSEHAEGKVEGSKGQNAAKVFGTEGHNGLLETGKSGTAIASKESDVEGLTSKPFQEAASLEAVGSGVGDGIEDEEAKPSGDTETSNGANANHNMEEEEPEEAPAAGGKFVPPSKKKRKDLLKQAEKERPAAVDMLDYFKDEKPDEKKDKKAASNATPDPLPMGPDVNAAAARIVSASEEEHGNAVEDDWETAELPTPDASSSGRPVADTKAKGKPEGRITYTKDFLMLFEKPWTMRPACLENKSLGELERVQSGGAPGPAGRGPPQFERAAQRGSALQTARSANAEDYWGKRTAPPGPQPPGMVRDGRPVPGRGIMPARSGMEGDQWKRATPLPPPPGMPFAGSKVALHKTADRFVPGKLDGDDPEEAKKQKEIKGLLNKITPEKYDTIKEQLVQIKYLDVKTLRGLIDQIFDKALGEPTFCRIYAQLCADLSPDMPSFPAVPANAETGEPGQEAVNFRRELLNKCQVEFEEGTAAMLAVARREKADAEAKRKEDQEEGEITSEDAKARRLQEVKAAAAELKARQRALGNIQFIGQLYKHGMLIEKIMHECLKSLLIEDNNPKQEDVECLCKLLTTVGKQIDSNPKSGQAMDAYFFRIQRMSTNKGLEARLRFMLQDVIDLRRSHWQARRVEEGPKTIKEIHDEAADQAAKAAARAAGADRRDRDMRRGFSDQRPPMRSAPRFDTTVVDAPIRAMTRVGAEITTLRPGGGSTTNLRPNGELAARSAATNAPAMSLRPQGRGAALQSDSSGQNGAIEPPTTMSEKEIEDQVVGFIGEYFSMRDIQEVDARLVDWAARNADFRLIVENLFSAAVKAKGFDAEKAAAFLDIMSHIGSSSTSPAPRDKLAAGFLSVIGERLEWLMEDNPRHACPLVGKVAAAWISAKVLTLEQILQRTKEACAKDGDDEEPELRANRGGIAVVCCTLQELLKVQSREEIGTAWQRSQCSLQDFISEGEDINEVMKKHDLDGLSLT